MKSDLARSPPMSAFNPRRTFSERHRCTVSEASRYVTASVPFQIKEAAFPKRARRQRLSVKVGAMVAELSF